MIRKRLLVALVGLSASGAAAQPPIPESEPVIAVVGAAEVSRAADWYDLTVSLRGDGATQLDALRALSAAQDAMRQGVGGLEGVTRAEIRTREARLTETYSPECERESRDRESRRPRDQCRPTGFIASTDSVVRIRPANRAGAALSLAGQRGAVAVRTEEAGVDDPAALRQAAVEAAVAAARRQAEAAARAGGVALGPVLRVIDSQARTVSRIDEVDAVVVTGSRVRAAVSLTLDPPPVTETARVTVVFRIGR
jgi:uncharacterized protein YggE